MPTKYANTRVMSNSLVVMGVVTVRGWQDWCRDFLLYSRVERLIYRQRVISGGRLERTLAPALASKM